jgi:hypothetical protein
MSKITKMAMLIVNYKSYRKFQLKYIQTVA